MKMSALNEYVEFGMLLVVLLVIYKLPTITGQSVEYILSGEDAPITPYHAHILINSNDLAKNTFIGSGSLISSQYVITCAQNIFGFKSFRVGFGSIYRANLTFYNGADTILHPEYNPQNLLNNIGFIVLDRPIGFSHIIKPIALVPVNSVLPFPAEQGVITGFGLMNANVSNKFPLQKQRGFQRVQATSDCHWRYPHLNNLPAQAHFCALDDDRARSNICGGDQGGSFATLVRGEWILMGIASFTERGCVGEMGAVYVRLSTYRQWIFRATGL